MKEYTEKYTKEAMELAKERFSEMKGQGRFCRFVKQNNNHIDFWSRKHLLTRG